MEDSIVVADPSMGLVTLPEEGDERAGVGVNDPQLRSFGAP